MNLWQPRRWENKRARRGLGWLMLLTVLTLCLTTLSRGGRAQPPPLTGPTVGELMARSQRNQVSVGSFPLSPSSPNPHRKHPMTVTFGGGGISVVTEPQYIEKGRGVEERRPTGEGRQSTVDGRQVPTFAASPGGPSAQVSPADAVASPSPEPAAVASPSPEPAAAASPTPEAEAVASPTPAAVATPWNPDAEGGGNSSIFISKLQQMVIMLFLVGFLAFATLKAMAKWLPGMATSGKRVKQLEVLERQALATGATVSLVRVGKKYLVLGQTEQNVNTLCELTEDQLEPAAQAAVAEKRPQAAPVPTLSFHGDILRHYLSIFPGFGAGRKGDV